MKTLAQLYAERLQSIPIGPDGKPDRIALACLSWTLHAEYWGPVTAIVNPLFLPGPGSAGEHFYEFGRAFHKGLETIESLETAKRYLGLSRLRFNTFFRLRRIFGEALQKARTERDIDVPFSAFVAFVQLVLGAKLDPAYGQFPATENHGNYFDDSYLSDNDDEARLELEDPDGEYYGGRHELEKLYWFRERRGIIRDAPIERFEEAFPGMGPIREHFAQALKPLFDHLDPMFEADLLALCLNWVQEFLKSALENQRLVRARPAAEETQLPAETSKELTDAL